MHVVAGMPKLRATRRETNGLYTLRSRSGRASADVIWCKRNEHLQDGQVFYVYTPLDQLSNEPENVGGQMT